MTKKLLISVLFIFLQPNSSLAWEVVGECLLRHENSETVLVLGEVSVDQKTKYVFFVRNKNHRWTQPNVGMVISFGGDVRGKAIFTAEQVYYEDPNVVVVNMDSHSTIRFLDNLAKGLRITVVLGGKTQSLDQDVSASLVGSSKGVRKFVGCSKLF